MLRWRLETDAVEESPSTRSDSGARLNRLDGDYHPRISSRKRRCRDLHSGDQEGGGSGAISIQFRILHAARASVVLPGSDRELGAAHPVADRLGDFSMALGLALFASDRGTAVHASLFSKPDGTVGRRGATSLSADGAGGWDGAGNHGSLCDGALSFYSRHAVRDRQFRLQPSKARPAVAAVHGADSPPNERVWRHLPGMSCAGALSRPPGETADAFAGIRRHGCNPVVVRI